MQNDVPTSRNVVGASACEDDAVVEVGKKFPEGKPFRRPEWRGGEEENQSRDHSH